MWDSIVIGSGIGGLAAAAALARSGRRVLVLEQHGIAGGLTQTFRRGDWSFATGLHYIGGVGPGGQFGRLLEWLAGGALQFNPCANPYDIVHLPGFEFGIPHPESAYRDALVARFAGERDAILAWFEHCEAARHSAFTVFALHAARALLGWAVRQWHGTEAERWARRTLADELVHIRTASLRGVLGARWGDYGAPPAQAPFLEHALMTGSDAAAVCPVAAWRRVWYRDERRAPDQPGTARAHAVAGLAVGRARRHQSGRGGPLHGRTAGGSRAGTGALGQAARGDLTPAIQRAFSSPPRMVSAS
ncbi:MAG TPA: NAD(P)-binding protein [Ramlibacter sp.]|nr:NAD(P)-binding protein [Ramlibacter sp.]